MEMLGETHVLMEMLGDTQEADEVQHNPQGVGHLGI